MRTWGHNGTYLCMYRAPFHSRFFHRNSNSMANSFHSHLDSNKVIATKFCTWHDSCAVVACAKICGNLPVSNGITARRDFHQIWITSKKSLVKRAPGPCGKQTSKYNTMSYFEILDRAGEILVYLVTEYGKHWNQIHKTDDYISRANSYRFPYILAPLSISRTFYDVESVPFRHSLEALYRWFRARL